MRIAKETEESRWGGGTDPRKDPEYLRVPANQWRHFPLGMKLHYKDSTPVQLLPVCGPESSELMSSEPSQGQTQTRHITCAMCNRGNHQDSGGCLAQAESQRTSGSLPPDDTKGMPGKRHSTGKGKEAGSYVVLWETCTQVKPTIFHFTAYP